MPQGDPLERPALVVGSTRSGTTLLGLMLDGHPAVGFHGEFDLAVDRMGPSGEPPELPDYHRWLATSRFFLHHGLRIDPALGYRELVVDFLRQMHARRATGAETWVGVAVHRRFECLPSLWPEARYLHIVRDGRDVATSFMARGWAGNHWTAALRWRGIEASWEAARARIPDGRVLDVHFEALVREPRETLERIGDFLGIPYDEAMLRYPERSTYGPVDPGELGKWRRQLSPRQVAWAEAAAGDLLARRGYTLAAAPRRVSAPERAALRVHDRAARLRFRIRRYGLRLWASRQLARALRLEGWRRRIELEHHAITNRQLK